MEITFKRKSSARETMRYTYVITPRFWVDGKPHEGWTAKGFTALHIDKLINLDHDFIVTLRAQEGEMETWLERYAEKYPKEAVSLLAKALQIAAGKLEEQPDEKE